MHVYDTCSSHILWLYTDRVQLRLLCPLALLSTSCCHIWSFYIQILTGGCCSGLTHSNINPVRVFYICLNTYPCTQYLLFPFFVWASWLLIGDSCCKCVQVNEASLEWLVYLCVGLVDQDSVITLRKHTHPIHLRFSFVTTCVNTHMHMCTHTM